MWRWRVLVFSLTMVMSACISVAAELKSNIEYGQAGGESLLLDASVPDGDGTFPVAIVVHGGGWASGDKAADPAPLLTALTDAKFAWFSINYRLAPAHRWPACFEDVNTAIRWVKQHAAEFKGDPRRVALIGYSAGGQLVCLAATNATPDTAVQAVVGVAPPTDLELDLPQRGGLSKSLQDLLDRPKEVSDDSRKQLKELSAINYVHAGLPPFLLIHGTADKSVPYAGSVAFMKKLRAVGVPCDLITLQGAPHRLADWEKYDPQYLAKATEWLHRCLDLPTTAPSASRPATQP
jgi:acetyl esterase/lipase